MIVRAHAPPAVLYPCAHQHKQWNSLLPEVSDHALSFLYDDADAHVRTSALRLMRTLEQASMEDME